MSFAIFYVFIYLMIAGFIIAMARHYGHEEESCGLIGAIWPVSIPLIIGLHIGKKIFGSSK